MINFNMRGMRFSLHTWLMIFSLLTLTPFLLVAAHLIIDRTAEQRAAIQNQMINIAYRESSSVNKFFDTTIGSLKTLSTGGALQRGDIKEVYNHANRILKSSPSYAAITLVGRNDQLVFHTAIPLGDETITTHNIELVHQVFATGEPNISGPFIAEITARSVIAVSVPVWVGGEVKYCLRMIVLTDALNDLLRQERLPQGWEAAIADRKGILTARTRNPDTYIGKMAIPEFVQAFSQTEAIFHGLTLEGLRITGYVAPIFGGDLYLGVGVEDKILNRPEYELLQNLVLLVSLTLVFSLLLSFVLSSFLSSQFRFVTQALTQRSSGANDQLRVSDFRSVVAGLIAGQGQADIIKEKLQDISAQHDLYADLYDSAPFGYHSLDTNGLITHVNKTMLGWLGYDKDELIGHHITEFLTDESNVYFTGSFAVFLKTGEVNNIEAEFIRKDGSKLPAVISATAVKDHSGEIVLSRTSIFDLTERKKLEERLDSLSRIDALTGLSNRRDFYDQAKRELTRSKRSASPLSVLMLDIDHFKTINDQYGHAAGDEVLKKLSLVCKESLRELDIVARIGGEEFVVLMPDTIKAKAIEVAERLRMTLSNTKVALDDGQTISFTVSIGVTGLVPSDTSIDSALKRADTAMYAAKSGGRNQVQAG